MECMWSIIIGKLYDCLLFVFDKYYKLFFTCLINLNNPNFYPSNIYNYWLIKFESLKISIKLNPIRQNTCKNKQNPEKLSFY